MTDRQCVTVTPTIQSGVVVRWFEDRYRMEHAQPILSASRDGVVGHGHGYITPDHGYITPDLFAAAWAAHEAIAGRGNVGPLATHRRRGLTGPYEPIERATEAVA